MIVKFSTQQCFTSDLWCFIRQIDEIEATITAFESRLDEIERSLRLSELDSASWYHLCFNLLLLFGSGTERDLVVHNIIRAGQGLVQCEIVKIKGPQVSREPGRIKCTVSIMQAIAVSDSIAWCVSLSQFCAVQKLLNGISG